LNTIQKDYSQGLYINNEATISQRNKAVLN